MKITLKNGALTETGLLVACPVDTEATVTAELGRDLIAQGLAVAVADEPKHRAKADAKPEKHVTQLAE